MQKKCFNQKYGLEQAVLDGRKTMFRNFVPIGLYNQTDWKAVGEGDFEATVDGEEYYHDIRDCGKYRIGEVVAIAQAYKDLEYVYFEDWLLDKDWFKKGWNNKTLVRAYIMQHHIKITDINVEHLQDISDEECLKEGVYPIKSEDAPQINETGVIYYTFSGVTGIWTTPRKAFAALIDKVSGKGTWERNPYVFCYSFVLVD